MPKSGEQSRRLQRWKHLTAPPSLIFAITWLIQKESLISYPWYFSTHGRAALNLLHLPCPTIFYLVRWIRYDRRHLKHLSAFAQWWLDCWDSGSLMKVIRSEPVAKRPERHLDGMWTACIDSAQTPHATCQQLCWEVNFDSDTAYSIWWYPLTQIFCFFFLFFIFLANLFERFSSMPKVSLELHMLPWLPSGKLQEFMASFCP